MSGDPNSIDYWEKEQEKYFARGTRGGKPFSFDPQWPSSPSPPRKISSSPLSEEDKLDDGNGSDEVYDPYADGDLDMEFIEGIKGSVTSDDPEDLDEWIECKEIRKPERTVFYNTHTLHVATDPDNLVFKYPDGKMRRLHDLILQQQHDMLGDDRKEDRNTEDLFSASGTWVMEMESFMQRPGLSEDAQHILEEVSHKLKQLQTLVESEQSSLDKTDVEALLDSQQSRWDLENTSVEGYRARAAKFPHQQFLHPDFNFPMYHSITPLTAQHLRPLAANVVMPSMVTKIDPSYRVVQLMVNPEDTPVSMVDKAIEKLPTHIANAVNWEQFVLKGLGLWEYYDGDDKMFSYDTVRECLRRRMTLELTLVVDPPKTQQSDESKFNEQQYMARVDKDLPVITVDSYLDSAIHRPWDMVEYIPMFEVDWPYKMKVLGCDHINKTNLPSLDPSVMTKLYVKTFLYHGTCILERSALSTKEVGFSEHPRWGELLESVDRPIILGSLPREARISLLLYGISTSERQEQKTLLGHVSVPLIDQFGHFNRGRKCFKLWPTMKDKEERKDWEFLFRGPIGEYSILSNQPLATVAVEFDKFVCPVVAPFREPFQTPDPKVVGEPVETKKLPKKQKIMYEYLTMKSHPLHELTAEEKDLIWKTRHNLTNNSKTLSKFMQSVDWFSPDHRHEAHRLLMQWQFPDSPVHAIELLDVKYADFMVREYAVKLLQILQDDQLKLLLLQLVQTLKFEPYHDSPLTRLLIERALRNPFTVGHFLFWHLKAEMNQLAYFERYYVILEEYLSFAGNHTEELRKQNDGVQRLARIAGQIVSLKRTKEKSDDEIMTLYHKKLNEFNTGFLNRIGSMQIALNPRWKATSLVVEKCRYMSSKMAPLWLVFRNEDPDGQELVFIFKSGDDLRQDILTLQLLQIMDRTWLGENLDMRLTPYECVATGWNAQGKGVGMIEAVLKSDTTSRIQLKYGGGALGALRLEPLDRFIRDYNKGEQEYNHAVENFMRSCAGYCVATYILGIGDRHNGNIMLTQDGHLFHIDFGHFLGNFKQKFGIKRERTAFVLTPEMAYVMGGRRYKNANNFKRFEEISKEAFKSLRRNSDLFINLFILMVSAGMPELMKTEDISYLRDKFYLDENASEASAVENLRKEIRKSLNTTFRQLDNFIHNLKHGK